MTFCLLFVLAALFVSPLKWLLTDGKGSEGLMRWRHGTAALCYALCSLCLIPLAWYPSWLDEQAQRTDYHFSRVPLELLESAPRRLSKPRNAFPSPFHSFSIPFPFVFLFIFLYCIYFIMFCLGGHGGRRGARAWLLAQPLDRLAALGPHAGQPHRLRRAAARLGDPPLRRATR